MENAIEVTDLSKIYKLYDRPSDRFKELIFNRKSHHEFAALQGISFKIAKGETLGIIGENGAGKSTLLRVMALLTAPQTGSVEFAGDEPEALGVVEQGRYGRLDGVANNILDALVFQTLQGRGIVQILAVLDHFDDLDVQTISGCYAALPLHPR